MEAIYDQLEADEYARKNTHDDDRGGPRSPCHSADEADEGKDDDEGRKEGQTRGERKELQAVDVHRERLNS